MNNTAEYTYCIGNEIGKWACASVSRCVYVECEVSAKLQLCFDRLHIHASVNKPCHNDIRSRPSIKSAPSNQQGQCYQTTIIKILSDFNSVYKMNIFIPNVLSENSVCRVAAIFAEGWISFWHCKPRLTTIKISV